MSNLSSVFVAYAASPEPIGATIEAGCETANKFSDSRKFATWKQNDIVGLDLVQPILENIKKSEYVVADISSVNNNVVYEIGYAIGCSKRVVITKSTTSQISSEELNRIGIFDTLGYETFSNDIEFAQKVTSDLSNRKIEIDFEKNNSNPVYIVGCATPNDISQRIASRIKKTRLGFRSFTPAEDIRLSAPEAIKKVSESLGLILEWRAGNDDISRRHNTRTAFVAGLGHALGVETVIFARTGTVVPLDFRNSTVEVSRIDDVDHGIAAFVPYVTEALQAVKQRPSRETSKLADIELGDPAAENELKDLNRYFLPSATYAAALKGNVKTVVGRKGSGKTALWARIRNALRSKKDGATVVDLKPEGYQLVRLREDVLVHLTYGQGLHVAAAFWEYLLLLEIANKVVENDRLLYTRDQRLTEGYEALSELVSEYSELGDSDFSERLHRLSAGVAGNLSSDRELMTGNFRGNELTNKIYAIDIKRFRNCLFDYLKKKGTTWILFDNLDRGWPTHGLENVDFTILRALIDAARKLERTFSKSDLELNAIVFIRDDIYTELVSRTSDFGKDQPSRIDWNDPEQLREMIRLRLADNYGFENKDFDECWSAIFCSHLMGEETSEFVIGRSMMRPRNILNLINHCRNVAVNCQNDIIKERDVEKGAMVYSTDLLVELSRELEDVLPEYETLLFDFIHSPQILELPALKEVLTRAGVPSGEHDRVVERLIYYGFIGVMVEGDEKYIFDFNYEIKLILATIRKFGGDTEFCIHPAFRTSLELG